MKATLLATAILALTLSGYSDANKANAEAEKAKAEAEKAKAELELARLKTGMLTLEGEEPVPQLGGLNGYVVSEKVVYYKNPFASPPYLTFPDGKQPDGYKITDEKAESFKVQIMAGCTAGKFKWKAEGLAAK
jgi:hypothetical protein